MKGYSLILLLLSSCATASPLVTNPGTGTLKNTQTGTVGQVFTVGSQNITVTSLGFWDNGGNGLATAHSVGIWTGAGALLASVSVKAGTASLAAGGFRFEPITSIVLNAGATYRLGARIIGGDLDSQRDSGSLSGIQYSPGVAPGGGAYSPLGSGFVFPSNLYGVPGVAHIGPNMEFTVEPSGLSAPGSLRLAP